MLEDNTLIMNYEYVIGLDQIRKKDIKIAGGKGANIGETREARTVYKDPNGWNKTNC